MEDMREKTHTRHYELYRQKRLEQMGFTDVDSDNKPVSHLLEFTGFCPHFNLLFLHLGFIPTNIRGQTIKPYGRTTRKGRRNETDVCVACQRKGSRAQGK